MYFAAGIIGLVFVLGLNWLFATVDDWSRDFTTNYAATAANAKKASLRPIISERPSKDLAHLVTTAAKKLTQKERLSSPKPLL